MQYAQFKIKKLEKLALLKLIYAISVSTITL